MTYVAVDQYGHFYGLKTKHPRKELLEKFCRQHADKMYVDGSFGTLHVGYIIAELWLNVYGVEGRKFARLVQTITKPENLIQIPQPK
jgi:hypothetical protein